MKKVSNIGALGMSLAKMQCLERNIGTCEAGLEICDQCSEKQKGQKRKFENDFKKKRKNEEATVLGSFILLCSLIFLAGLLSGIYVRSVSEKLICVAILFFLVAYISRNKLEGRILYGGMEKPYVFSFGLSLFFLGSLFLSQKTQFMEYAILCYVPGVYFFYRGYEAGPFNGWSNFFRQLK